MSRFRAQTAAGIVAAVIAGASFGGADTAVARGGKAAKPAAGHVKGKAGVRQVHAVAAGRKVG